MFASLRGTASPSSSSLRRTTFFSKNARRLAQNSSSSLSSSSDAPTHTHTQHRTYATEIWKNTKSSELSTALARGTSLFKSPPPHTNSTRHVRAPLNTHLYQGKPVRFLTIPKRKTGGRNHHGVITVRHQGGGHKRRIRTVDFWREQEGVQDVVRIEYDPGRSAHIALVRSREAVAEKGGQVYSYILATEGMRAGDEVRSFRKGIPAGFIPGFDSSSATSGGTGGGTEEAAQSLAVGLLRSLTLKPGNVLPLRLIPTGTVINSISLHPSGPGILVRSAGTFAQVVLNDTGSGNGGSKYVHVKLQSGEVRKVLRDCCATVGKVSNPLWKNRSLGKAGRARWLGVRPTVRGVAMNANDHPHGGGRGKSKSNKHPVSIWGWGTKGTRTRKPGPKGPKNSNKMVIRERPRGKEKRGL